MNKRGQMRKQQKKGIISDYLPWLILGIVLLILLSMSALLLKDKGFEFIDKILNVFRGK